MWKSKRPQAIRDLQTAVKNIVSFDRAVTRIRLRSVVDEGLWRRCRDGSGQPFQEFDEWALASQPEGLGIDCKENAEYFRDLLLENGDVRAWGSILLRIARPPGRPKTLAEDEDLARFYRITTATTGRMLLRLIRDWPEYYDKLCAGEFNTIRQAASAAGFVKVSPRNAWRPIRAAKEAFATWPTPDKIAFLRELLTDVEDDVRSALLEILTLRRAKPRP